MSRIKTLNAKRYVAVFMAMLITVLSLSYTNNKTNANATSKTRTYWRHNYSSRDLKSYYPYDLTVDSNNNNNNNNSKVIFPPNDMVRDYDTSVVRLDDGADACGGTGFIVGDHTIATAAHCVYSRDYKRFLSFKISIVDSNNNVIKTISPHYAHVSADYTTSSYYNNKYDYAMIYVDEDLSQYGSFNLGVALDSYADNKGSVIVSGFPQEYPDDYKGSDWGIRFKAKGNITGKTQGTLRYNADMTHGDSGGPVYIEEGITINGELQEYKTAIAINVSYPEVSKAYNEGVKMTAEVLKLYGDNPNKTE